MEEYQKEIQMLQLMHQPALLVERGIILYANPPAVRYLLHSGMDFAALLATGQAEYSNFPEGTLRLTLRMENRLFDATVLRDSRRDLVVLEEAGPTSPLHALALAAMELRLPLSGASAIAERLYASRDASAQEQEYAAQLNRRLMQMQRIVSNMSDCESFGQADERDMEYIEVCGFLQELLQRAADPLAQAGLLLQWELPQQRLDTLAYPQKLERAIYNLLSNAGKFSPRDGIIRVQLRCHGDRISISVSDCGPGISGNGDIFTRYMRQPSLDDPRNGLGLGMALIHATAAAHGGVVLLDQPEGWGSRFTITLAIRHRGDRMLHSPVMRIDYAGEKDHCLLELSDVLPAELYK